jgi:hypothetical protein
MHAPKHPPWSKPLIKGRFKVGGIQGLGEVTWIADVALPLTPAINTPLDFTLIHDTLENTTL